MLLFCSLIVTMHITKAKLNPSRSIPIGIYVPDPTPIHVGSLVWFRPPLAISKYIKSLGTEVSSKYEWAFNGFTKPVIAMTGDTICEDPFTRRFSVNGRELGVALATNSTGVELPTFIGCHKLQDEVAVYSDEIDDSLDSRYYGAIKMTEVRHYKPWAIIQ